MSLGADLKSEVARIFKEAWSERDGTVVPDDTSLKLGNDAINLTATVLYADLADSTKLVDGHANFFAAEIYKSVLHCAAKIIREEKGEITAYDGDRIMAVFIGDRKNSRAVTAALKIRWAISEIVTPAKAAVYGTTYTPACVVGIDTSKLFVAKTGIRGANDLVWVGRAANYAAKLAALDPPRTYITQEVYDVLDKVAKFSYGVDMWEPVPWTEFDGRTIYASSWWWSFD